MNEHLDTIKCIYYSRPNKQRAESHAKLRYGTHEEALRYITDRLYQPSAEVERILLDMRKSPRLAFEYVYRMGTRSSNKPISLLFRFHDALRTLICKDPYLCYRYVAHVIQKACPELEHIICQDGLASAHYAEGVLRKPFPQGEQAITNNAMASVFYAEHVLRKPFPQGEETIATDASCSLNYAMFLKKRFPQGEKALCTNASCAVHYAHNVIGGRWKEAEKAIAQDGMSAYTYVMQVVKQRWKQGEAAIAKLTNCYYPTFYAEKFLKGRFPLYEQEIATHKSNDQLFLKCIMYYLYNAVRGRLTVVEPIIACHAKESLEYACLINDRFPLGEASIAADKKISLQYAKLILKPLNLL